MTRRARVLILAAVTAGATPLAAEAPYRLLGGVPLAGGSAATDLLADPESRRLYVSRGSGVVVVDLDTYRVIGEIADAPGARGFAVAPDLGLGFTSNAREARASIVDLGTLKTLSKADLGEDPGQVLYARGIHEVYVFNRRGRSATVFEARNGRVVTTIPLPGRPGSAVVDPEGGRIYTAIEDGSVLAVIDASRRRVVATWPTAPCESPTAIAADAEHRHLLLGCGNGLMALMDALSGRVQSIVPTGGGVSACAFDPVSGLAFASSTAGNLTVAREAARDTLAVVQSLQTGPTTGAMAVDRRTHRVFLPAAAPEPKGDAPASLRIFVFGRE